MSQTSNEQLTQLKRQFISEGVGITTTNFIQSAKGAILRDVEGREFIDFAGGIGVMNIGHSHPKVVAAIKEQAERFTHTCFMVNPYEPAVKLAERLCRITPGDFPKRAAFLNCGAEAVENAVKIARCYTKRPAVIVFENAYHGRTLLTMTMTSKVKPYKFGFGPFAPEVYRIPFGDVAGAVRAARRHPRYEDEPAACLDHRGLREMTAWLTQFVAADLSFRHNALLQLSTSDAARCRRAAHMVWSATMLPSVSMKRAMKPCSPIEVRGMTTEPPQAATRPSMASKSALPFRYTSVPV